MKRCHNLSLLMLLLLILWLKVVVVLNVVVIVVIVVVNLEVDLVLFLLLLNRVCLPLLKLLALPEYMDPSFLLIAATDWLSRY